MNHTSKNNNLITKDLNKQSFIDVINGFSAFFKSYELIIFRIILVLSAITFFMYNYSEALLKGGRWDLYQHIAMADRFLEGKGFYYSTYEASTPYFPGVAFLSVIITLVFGKYRVFAMLGIASMIGALFFCGLVYLSFKVSNNRWISLFLCMYIMFIYFPFYKYYMNEFKADTLIYVYALILVIILVKLQDGKKITKTQVTSLFLISFLMDITKQQALYIDAALGIYILLTRKYSLNKKIIILSAMIVAGVVDIIVLLSIPGLKIIAIENLKNMPFWDFNHIYSELNECYSSHKLIVFMFLLSLVFMVNNLKGVNSYYAMWLFISFFVGASQLAGGMKIGGNIGNYQAGLVLFVPFVSIPITKVFDFFINKDRMIYTYILFIFLSLFSICISVNNSLYKSLNVKQLNEDNNIIIDYLSERCSNKKMIYNSDDYILLTEAKTNPVVDVCTIPYYCDEYYLYLQNAFESHGFEYALLDLEVLELYDNIENNYYGKETQYKKTFLENYCLLEDEKMPTGLRGKLYVLKQKGD